MDATREERSQKVRKFLNRIKATLRSLEEGTLWSNCAELCLGLLNEVVTKDMKEVDSPLVLWDYCVEQRDMSHDL